MTYSVRHANYEADLYSGTLGPNKGSTKGIRRVRTIDLQNTKILAMIHEKDKTQNLNVIYNFEKSLNGCKGD
ncbi:hypothetical protein CmeUKMEL1_09950 [Cryptosporidium meleagridis]|uniref:Uncharacterized protein n=1 Tax=Cryptosporidium meleagridis TaxID=93969 RepID=A0A2P4Z1Q9_9CRYT|nr:hypothetical protein CmeUKMEL1_09950 [Cryptosporidium meleagridis]